MVQGVPAIDIKVVISVTTGSLARYPDTTFGQYQNRIPTATFAFVRNTETDQHAGPCS